MLTDRGRNMEILTVVEVAAMLKVSKRHVYELTKNHTQPGDTLFAVAPTR
jgi:hypothetical protein